MFCSKARNGVRMDVRLTKIIRKALATILRREKGKFNEELPYVP